MLIFVNTHPLFSDLSLVSCRKNGEIRGKGSTLQNLDYSRVKVEHSSFSYVDLVVHLIVLHPTKKDVVSAKTIQIEALVVIFT